MQEHEKARAWRESHNLTPQQLADLTGYSRESIYWYEKGTTPPRIVRGKRSKAGPIPEWVWQRYKRACEGVHCQLVTCKTFDW